VSDATRWLCRGEHALTPSQIPAGWTFDGPIVDRDVNPENMIVDGQPVSITNGVYGNFESYEAFVAAVRAVFS
jgi:hypothetical protein